MIWENLSRTPPLCPMCETELEWNPNSKRWICSDFMNCDFIISESKFNEIIENNIPAFNGVCENCGRNINPKYRTCKNCI